MKRRISYSAPPLDWRSLQDKVRQIFSDIGYKACVAKKVRTARGKVEIDVFAEKGIETKTTILCECKHWKSRVPQGVVHPFSSVVQNYGAVAVSQAGLEIIFRSSGRQPRKSPDSIGAFSYLILP